MGRRTFAGNRRTPKKAWGCIPLFALVLGSCLQAVSEGPLPGYLPRAQSVRSGPFYVDGDDLIIVAVSGAVLRPGLSPGHFALTRDNQPVPLSPPVRVGDGHVLFGFDAPPESHYNFRLTVHPEAVHGDTSIMRVTASAVTSGTRVNLEDTVFGDNAIRSLAYGNGVFVATGDAGMMAHSSDGGRSWVPIPTGHEGTRFENAVYAVAFGSSGELVGGTRFYAVGADARMAWSANGTGWAGYRIPHPPQAEPGPPPPPVYGHVLFGGGDMHAVAFGRGGTSQDARFVVGGCGGRTIFRWWDPGMLLWAWVVGTGLDSGHTVNTIVWGDTGGNGRFVAAGSGGSIYWATDASGSQTWTPADAGFDDRDFRASAFGNGVFVVGGDGGRMVWSNDGMDWNFVDGLPGEDAGVLAMAFGAGVFVAAGHGGTVMQSMDGITWDLIPDSGFAAGERINGVATDGRGRFVAVGNCAATGVARIVSWYQRPLGLAAVADGPDAKEAE